MRQPLFGMVLALLFAGCGGKQESEKKKAGTDADSKPVKKDVIAKPSVKASEPPPGFPVEVPFYPGAALRSRGTDGVGIHVRLAAADPLKKVASYYESQLRMKGWTVSTRPTKADAVSLYAYREEERLDCSVVMRREGGETIVAITLVVDEPEAKKKEAAPKEIAKKKAPTFAGEPLPKDLPEDIPLYPDGKVTASFHEPDRSSVAMTTSHRAEKVLAFVALNAKKLGWKQIARKEDENNILVVMEKEDRILTVTIDQDEREALIVFGVSRKKGP